MQIFLSYIAFLLICATDYTFGQSDAAQIEARCQSNEQNYSWKNNFRVVQISCNTNFF